MHSHAIDPTAPVAFGRTNLRVTRMGIGTVPIAGLYEPVPDAQAQATLRRAYELGVRLFDTAPLYGYGVAEQRLGTFLATVPKDDACVVATKVGRALQSARIGDEPSHRGPVQQRQFKSGAELEPVFDFSYDGARRVLESSLERLGLGRVDIVYIHDPDDHYEQAVEGAYRALEDLRSEGAVSAVGVGMNQSAMLARFARDTDVNCFLLAGRYTLLEQGALDELLPLCEQKGISVVIGGVFNSGVLADPSPGAHYNYSLVEPVVLDRVKRIAAICARHGVPLAAAALQFPFGHPAIATVLCGVRSPQEVEEDERLMRLPIPTDLWAELKSEGLVRPDAPVPSA
jgi:D-threo-aldose 1-dehydrogenase